VRIQPKSRVELAYELFDEDGELVESGDAADPIVYVHGSGELPAELEAALLGKSVGDHVRVELGAGVAFGDFDPEGIVSVPRESFPPDAELVPGEVVTVQLEDDEGDGGEMEMAILEISPDGIVLDANHPLAGRAVTFDVRVLSVLDE
jgi:FKBP-type peptidyl-prolyl cis-trans isomerase SlyD